MKNYNKISDVISSQVPAFFNDEYPNLILFLQAYYKFLESQQINRNIESFRDIDTTLEQFVGVLKGELASSSPYYENIKAYLPHLKQHFISKGSEESYALLFRLLYNKDVEVAYPGSSVLRLSEGKWNQDKSIQIKVTAGDVQKINNKFIFVQTAKNKIKFHVKQINTLDVVTGIYELFLDKNYLDNISIGDTITYDGVIATVLPSISKVTITDGGLNYKVGDFYPITATGTGASVKVKKVSSLGTILEVELIEFGKGYTANFETSLSTSSYFDDLEPDLLLENGNSLASEQQTDAILFFDIGTISTYPGYYLTEENFVSGLSYIQDGYFYQDYSYVVNVDERLDSYKQYVLDFVHPAGKKLFGKYTIQNDFELLAEIALTILKFQFPEVITTDDYTLYAVAKLLIDEQEIVDKAAVYLTKAPVNDATGATTDSKKADTHKVATDTTSGFTETLKSDIHSTLFDSATLIETLKSDIHSTRVDATDNTTDFTETDAHKVVADTTSGFTETDILDIHSTLFDGVSLTETDILDIHSTAFDGVSLTETDILDIHSTLFDTTSGFTETDVIDMRKVIADATATSTETDILDIRKILSDSATIADSLSNSFFTSVSDAISIDERITGIGKAIADSVINTDSGIIQVNPYDITGDYFAEVYQTGRSTF